VTSSGARPSRLLEVRAGEWTPLAWSFVYFFSLLCGYYILRPVREDMGLVGGFKNLPWLMTGTFVATLAVVPAFAALVARFTRARVLPFVYRFFLLHLLVFYVLVRADVAPVVVARAFYIWLSVFNLLVVSVFWAFMADVWRSEQGKRLFGVISAGGSAGALIGPLVAGQLARPLGTANLLLLGAVLLELSTQCLGRLARGAATAAPATDRPVGGRMDDAIVAIVRSPTLALMTVQTLLFVTGSTFVYLTQNAIIDAAVKDRTTRTELFANIDLIVNVASLAMQALLFHRVAMRRLGLAVSLAAVPVLSAIGFGALGAAPSLAVAVGFMIARRAGHYAFERPAREVLWTPVPRDAKYKSKTFIDTCRDPQHPAA
jgi:AAA family ATP:ADP antiporter